MSLRTPIPQAGTGSPAAGWILVALAALAPLFPPETRGDSLAGCAALCALLALVGWRLAPSVGQASVVLGLLLLLPAVRASMAPAASVQPIAISILAAAVGLTAVGLRRDARNLDQVAVTQGLAGGAVALHALYQWLWGLERLAGVASQDSSLPDRAAVLARLAGGRAFAGFATPAALGGFLALSLPLVVALALRSTGRRRAAWTAVALLEGGAFLAAASATAAAALLGAVALWAALRRHSWRAWGVGIALLLLLLVGVSLQRDRIVLRPEDPTGPWKLRLGNFHAAWAMAADHPWSGVGPGAFGEVYPAYRRPGDNETRHAHDLPLELAAELGWPAGALCGLLWLGLFLGPLAAVRRRPEPLVQAAAIGLATFGLHNLADFTSFMPSILWPAVLLRGLIATQDDLSDARDPSIGWDRALATVSLVVVLGAAVIAGRAGLADNARWDARRLAFAGSLGAALPLAERASRLAPWDVDAASLLARLSVDAVRTGALPGGAAELALARAERAVRIGPSYAPAYEIRAAARRMTGDAAGAFADLSEAARLHPLRADYAAARDRLRHAVLHTPAVEQQP